MKTISIEDKTWTRLTMLKASLMMKNLDILISELLDIGEGEIRRKHSEDNTGVTED